MELALGWVEKFMRRHRLTLRKPTSVAQKAPIDYEDKIVSFVLFSENLRKKRKYKYIVGADETGIWLNPTGGLCVEQIGAKDVTVLASGNTKLRISVILTACSDGTRMKPFVLLPYKEQKSKIAKAIKNRFGQRIHLVFKNTTWTNDEIVEEYLQKNFGGLFQPRRLLVWDAFKAHISHNTKAVMKRHNVEMSVIPGGCTRFVQPADVSWNKPFKAMVMQLYNHWMMHGEHEATAAGDPKPPPPEVYLEWALEAWYDGVTKDNVVNSFKTCGITTAHDGSEDHLIHCLKDGNGMPNGCYKLVQKREEAEAEDLAQLMAGFELDLDEDDVGNVSDAEIIEDHDEEGNNNEESESSDDSDS